MSDLDKKGVQVKEDQHDHKEEEEYNEEEDEDYVAGDDQDEEQDDEREEDEKDDEEKVKYDHIESEQGGLVKTRRLRLEEEAQEKQFKKAEKEKTSVDIDSFWKEMKSTKPRASIGSNASATGSAGASASAGASSSPGSGPGSASATPAQGLKEPEKIKIKSTYEFAGKVITEDKWVDSNSAEAKLYLGSVKLKQELELAKPKLPAKKGIRRKRPSLLDAVINDEKALKLSTLEKSRLDWSSYVDKEGIKDELTQNNKGGYLQKQDFLDRVLRKVDTNYKAAQDVAKKQ